jgi:hypothetical protein
MSVGTTLHIGENSLEHIAYKLFCDVMYAEGRTIIQDNNGTVDRAYILRTYLECRRVGLGRSHLSGKPLQISLCGLHAVDGAG